MRHRVFSWLDLPVVLLLAALFLYGWRLPPESRAGALAVTARGGTTEEKLSPDRLERIEGPLGVTVMEVKDGRVRITRSPCAEKLCIRTGWIARPGEAVVCAPNKVAARLLGGSGGTDAVAR